MRILSIDPGLDVTGVAVWRPEPRRAPWMAATAVDKLGVLDDVVLLRTSPRDPMPQRMAYLFSELRHLALERVARLAYVETPARAGSYQRHRRAARGEVGEMLAAPLMGFHMACGAIYAALVEAHVTVEECRAGRASKAEKRELVNHARRQAGYDPLRNQDAVDALFVGLAAAWDVAA